MLFTKFPSVAVIPLQKKLYAFLFKLHSTFWKIGGTKILTHITSIYYKRIQNNDIYIAGKCQLQSYQSEKKTKQHSAGI